MTERTFRFELPSFDEYVDLCILLTNEHIEKNTLIESDYNYYCRTLEESKRRSPKRITRKENKDRNALLERE